MNELKYEEIWNLICKYSNNIMTVISEIDKEKNIRSLLVFNIEAKDKIHSQYESYKDSLKIGCLIQESMRIDRHKIAACMARAILSERPFKFKDDQKKHPRLVYLANETLAILVSLALVESFKGTKIMLPETDQDDYLTWLGIALAECSEMNSFNTMMYANVLFLLEHYSAGKVNLK